MPNNAAPTSFRDLESHAGEGIGQAFRIYGLNPLYGRLYTSLFLSAEPISLPQLTKRLNVAKSTVSVAIRQLVSFGVVRRENRPGDRRDYYAIVDDPMAVLSHFLHHFVTLEIQHGQDVVDTLQAALQQPGGDDWPDDEALHVLQRRVQALALVTQLSATLVSDILQGPGRLTQDHLIDVLLGYVDRLRATAPSDIPHPEPA